jgi:hypothetical protein
MVFSDPRSDVLVTNMGQLIEVAPTERSLDQDYPTLRSVVPAGSSLRGRMYQPPRTTAVVIPGRRGKSDSRNNPVSLTAEDVMRDIALNEILKLQDRGTSSGEGSAESSLERMYYEQLLTGRSGAAETSPYYDLFGLRKQTDKRSREAESPAGDSESSEQSLRTLLGFDPPAALSGPVGRSENAFDFLGKDRDSGRSAASSEWTVKPEENLQMKQFRNLLDGVYDVDPPKSVEADRASGRWMSVSPVPPSLPGYSPLSTGQRPMANPGLQPPTAPLAPVPSSLSPDPYAPLSRKVPPPKALRPGPQRAF